MTGSGEKIAALGLCSGGLDSMLSALVLREQGVEVTWVSFETPFFSSEKAREAARMTGVPLLVENLMPMYLDVLLNPKAGYGKNMNPCMDCHALMFRQAGRIMEKTGASFLFSGEVLGQRPKSQTKNALNYVANHSGYRGYILRPLSAKHLAPTIPEIEGWVDRERLLDLSGRSRKPQMAIAERYGITRYPVPAGGCLLTEEGYSHRLRDLLDHQESYGDRDFHLLKHGRHFRLSANAKAIVGRNLADNAGIEALTDPSVDVELSMAHIPGPKVILPHGAPREAMEQAARICAAYSKAPAGSEVDVSVAGPGVRETVRVLTPDKEELSGLIL